MSDTSIEIIAEVANAHQGRSDLAARLAAKGFEAGADAVKFQVYFGEELLVRRHPRYEHFRNQAFSERDWRELIPAAKRLGRVYCDVFGPKAFEVAATNGADGFKLHSSDMTNLPLIDMIVATRLPVFLSAGGTSARELIAALDRLAGHASRIVILHGFQSYPTPLEDTCLARLDWLHETFGEICQIGYADHIAGEDPFAQILPIMAIARGARAIEKHLTLDRSAKGTDYYSSMNPDEFQAFVGKVRRAETALASAPSVFTNNERHYRNTVKKHWVASRGLTKGHRIGPGDLVMKRVPDATGNSIELDKCLGRKLTRDLAEEAVISRADIEQVVWALPVARSASSRLPGKARLDVAGVPALGHLFMRLKRIDVVDRIVFCTTTLPEDDPLADLARAYDIDCHRGPVDDVLARMIGAIEGQNVDIVLRVTGDDILIDKEYVERAVAYHLEHNAEYTDLKQLPSGTEVEVFDAALLRDIYHAANDSSGTEYLTFYVTRNPDQFRTASAPVDPRHAKDWRLTLDTPEDYEVIKIFLQHARETQKQFDYSLDDIIDFFTANPDVLEINKGVRQKQGPITVDTHLEWRKILNRPASPITRS